MKDMMGQKFYLFDSEFSPKHRTDVCVLMIFVPSFGSIRGFMTRQ